MFDILFYKLEYDENSPVSGLERRGRGIQLSGALPQGACSSGEVDGGHRGHDHLWDKHRLGRNRTMVARGTRRERHQAAKAAGASLLL